MKTLWALLASVLLVVTAVEAQTYPPDVAWPGTITPPALTRPAYRQSVLETTLGTRITRISGSEMNPSSPIYIQHNYSKDQPWNADMTLIKLSGAVYILNANDYTVFRQWNWHNDSRWSTVDPDILFYTTGNQFRKVNVRTLTDTLLHTFAQGNIRMGPDEGNISIGDGMVVFVVGQVAIVYNIATDTVVSSVNIGSAGSDWVSISASGAHVVVCSNTGGGVHVYNTSLVFVRTLYSQCGHGDTGYDFAENEVLAQMCASRFARLSTGASTDLTPSGCNGHISLRNYNRRGWAYLSQFNALYAKRLDSSTTVNIFGYHRSTENIYDSQAKGTVSPDGSKMMFNSDWGTAGGPVYAFVADVPVASDTTPPTTPVITATANGAAQISIAITTPSTDFVGVTGYRLRKCSPSPCTPSTIFQVLAPGATGYVDTEVLASTGYAYSLSAFDAAGNESSFSATVSDTTSALHRIVDFFDNFQRADNADIGANYDAGLNSAGAFAIALEQLRISALNTTAKETYNGVLENDQWCLITLTTLTGTSVQAPGCGTRFSASGAKNGYEFVANPNTPQFRIIKWTADTASDVTAPVAGTSILGDKILGQSVGTLHSLYRIRNGIQTLIMSGTDATHASGRGELTNFIDTGAAGDAQIGSVAFGHFSETPSTLPTVATLTITSTQATLTTTGSPVFLRVSTTTASVVSPIEDVVGGVLPFPATITNSITAAGVTICPQDVTGAENTAGCLTDTVDVPTDTTPPIVTDTTNTPLPAGSTSGTISVSTDELASCKHDLSSPAVTEEGYLAMLSTFAQNSLTHSDTLTGLTDDSSTTVYALCRDPAGNLSTVLPLTLAVAASTADTTRPGDVSDLVGVVLSASQVRWTWAEATGGDIASYSLYLCSPTPCTNYGLAQQGIATTTTTTNLTPGVSYAGVVKAIDTSNNESLNFSTPFPVTLQQILDTERPSTMVNLRVTGQFTNSILLNAAAGTDNVGITGAVLELSSGATCENFSSVSHEMFGREFLIKNLPAGTTRCVRGKWSDGTNLSLSYSNEVVVTTSSAGLAQPRQPAVLRAPAGARDQITIPRTPR